MKRFSLLLSLAAVAALAFATAAAAQTTSIGLSTVRAQRFGNENLLGFYTPQAGDLFSWRLATGDFNGDGADDLATSLPQDDGYTGSPVVDSGTVIVRYGIPGSGLATPLASTVLRASSTLHPPKAGDAFGFSLASCDFNGDGFDDLAVGVPGAAVSGESWAGGVQIHYGASNGIDWAGSAFYTQGTPGMPGDPEESDFFGHELACGDFNADGFADLAITALGEDFWEGMIDIVPGSAAGLDPAHATAFKQDSPGLGGTAEDDDQFGFRLASGDFNGDGFADLAVGAVGEDDFAGQLSVVFGSASGLTGAGSLFWSESFLGGSSEPDDQFADGFSVGDFDGDGFDDLAIATPLEELGSGSTVVDSGRVIVLYGAARVGFNRNRTQFWTEDNIWFAGASETNDVFGVGLAAGDFDKDGRDDLAIGHPGEFLRGPLDGALTVLMGSAAGLTTARRRDIAAGMEGFPGDISQHDKLFAEELAAGDFDGDGHADLAIGVPYEDENGIPDVGAETVLYGSLFADGFETANTALWSQTVSSSLRNKVLVDATARLGPPASKLGLLVSLFNPTAFFPATPAYVRVGPEAGFKDETALKGSFFVDPQGLTMSTTANLNAFQMIAFNDGIGAGSKTRLIFSLTRATADGWFINVTHFNETLNSLQASGGGFFACADLPCGNKADWHNNRIEFEWTRGNPGQLTMWRTRFVNGVPDSTGTVQMLSIQLPGMQSAVINHAFAGMFAGQDPGTFGSLFLDELSFKRQP